MSESQTSGSSKSGNPLVLLNNHECIYVGDTPRGQMSDDVAGNVNAVTICLMHGTKQYVLHKQ